MPRKRFGQHFLWDPNVIQSIIARIAPQQSDHIVEIGPGPGVLTAHLIASGAHVTAIEIDRDLARRLTQQWSAESNFELHVGDVLEFDFARAYVDRPLKIVGNLPYNISTPLLFHVLQSLDYTSDMIFMVQKEVAERLSAPTSTGHYGRLSVAVQRHCVVEQQFDVPPDAFDPPPAVQSSVIRLRPRPRQADRTVDREIDLLLRTAFSKRRKTLTNALRGLLTAEDIRHCRIDPGSRPENLTPSEFEQLALILREKSRL